MKKRWGGRRKEEKRGRRKKGREAWEEEEEEGKRGMGGGGGRREGSETAIGDIGVDAVSMLFLGRSGKHKLASGSLGFGNITGYSILSGMALGMEPISSQAFSAKKYSLMCLTLQGTILILVVACLSISLLCLEMKPILLLCGQDPISTSVASTYLTFSLPPSSSSPGVSFFFSSLPPPPSSLASLFFIPLSLPPFPSSSFFLNIFTKQINIFSE